MATPEQLARQIGELGRTICELEAENRELRRAASAFGALAERLNTQLIATRHPPAWRRGLTASLAAIRQSIARLSSNNIRQNPSSGYQGSARSRSA